MIPVEITILAAEALSRHNDGLVKTEARKKLEEIKVYIESVLKEN